MKWKNQCKISEFLWNNVLFRYLVEKIFQSILVICGVDILEFKSNKNLNKPTNP